MTTSNQNPSLKELQLIRQELAELNAQLRRSQKIEVVDQVAKGVAIAIGFWVVVVFVLQIILSRF